MIAVPDADGSLDLRLVAADLLAVAAQDLVLALHALEAAADVAGVGVLRNGPQRPPLPAAADEDRQVLLDREREVQRVVRVVEASSRTGASPSSMPRMIWTASSSQRSRSPGEPPELDAEAVVLGLEPGAADAEDRASVADVVERR